MKKIWIGLTCALTLVLLACSAYYFVKWQSNESLKNILRKEEKIANESFNVKDYEKIGQSYYLKLNSKSSAIYNELLTWNETYLSKKKLLGNQVAIIRAKSQESGLKDVKQVLVHQLIYKKSVLSYKKQSDKVIRQFHIKSDQTILTLNDLLTNSISRLSEEVKKLYPDKNYSEIDLKAEFNKNGLASDGFEYKDNKLILNNGEFEIPIQNLFDVINPAFLNDNDLAAYNAYLAQKQAQEQAAAEEKARKEEEAKQAQASLASGKVVALTFDDGPSSTTTPQVLDILAKYGIHATFFVLGSHISGNESILQRMVSEGNEIGNHTWNHVSLSALSTVQVSSEISSTNQAIQAATGYCPKVFRPPYGATNATVQAAAGIHQVLWSVDTLDWKSHNTQAILSNVQNQVKPGGVILMHDIHQTTVDALPTIIDYLKSQGYSFVTVSQLYGF